MKAIADELEIVVHNYYSLLHEVDEKKASVKPSADKWSCKEILGHLVDSAQNNLRRFIVAQYEPAPKITYRQDDWVRINNYQDAKLKDLIQLWYLTNRQLITVLRNSDEKEGEKTCETDEPHTINWLAEDYIRHLRHHLHQVLDLEEVAYP